MTATIKRMRRPEPCYTAYIGDGVVEDRYIGAARADRARAYAEAAGIAYDYDESANGCHGCYARRDCRIRRSETEAEFQARIEKDREQKEETRRKRTERIHYLRRFMPSNRRWLKNQTVTCFGMRICEPSGTSRRTPQSNDEVSILRTIGKRDSVGWLVYADWLDEHNVSELAGQIRYHVANYKKYA